MKHSLALLVMVVAACGRPAVPAPVEMKAGVPEPRITGPYVHENLAVYLIHSDHQDDRDFITLDEGLRDGTVTVTEKDQEQVSELLLENKSSKPLFVQEGDRVKGGKQDRIVGLSFVVPSQSGPRRVPSFCIERGRWDGDKARLAFGNTQSSALAEKSVRAAAKADKDQGGVWESVGRVKRKAQLELGAENSNTSLNETLDSEKAKKAVEPYVKALEQILAGKSDVVGVAFALNGRIEEVNVYPGFKLLAKLYPRLLGSYALAAALEKKEGAAPPVSEVAAFMKECREKSKRTEQVGENRVTIRDNEEKIECLTEYQGQAVHSQWMRR